MSMNRELTVEEAAVELGLKEQTVRQYISEGKIKARKRGSRVRICPLDNADLWQRRQEELRLDAVA